MTLFNNLYPITREHCDKASDILANAFSEKPMLKILEISNQDMKNMFEMMVRFCLKYGEVFATSPNLEGIMAFMPDTYADMKTWHMLRSGAIFPVMKIKKQLMDILKISGELMDKEKKNLTIGPYIYLLSIGIEQGHQGKSLGVKLINALLEKADKEKKAIYLETDTLSNVTLYEKFGFTVHKELLIPGINTPMWTMVRINK